MYRFWLFFNTKYESIDKRYSKYSVRRPYEPDQPYGDGIEEMPARQGCHVPQSCQMGSDPISDQTLGKTPVKKQIVLVILR